MDTTVAATAPSPAPTMTPPQVNTNPAPVMAANGAMTPTASGGTFQESFKKALSNPVQIGFGIITTAALFYAIYYFQYNIRFSKTFVKSVENKMDDLDMKYADILSKLNSQPQETTPQDNLNLNIW